jgi:hypothetical protein
MAGLTFDTGALIGLERSRHRMRKVFDVAVSHGVSITVPSSVVAEWWRPGAGAKLRGSILRAMRVEALDTHLAKLAGEALARVPGAGTIDAIVMASASMRGDIVYTSDPDDLEILRAGMFRDVRIEVA